MKRFTALLLLTFLSTAMLSCQQSSNPVASQSTLIIKSIAIDPPVIAKDETAKLLANIELNGVDNASDISYTWASDSGVVLYPNDQVSYWSPKNTSTGTFKIYLSVTHNGVTAKGVALVRVVETPASGWGSISGFLYSPEAVPIANLTVSTVTGETGKTDQTGFFYIPNIPQGITSLKFPDLDYAWALDIPAAIKVSSGSHFHIGNITLWPSTPPTLLSATPIPGRRMLITWDTTSTNMMLYRYLDLYQGGQLLDRMTPGGQSVLIQSQTPYYASFQLRVIPTNGLPSNLSNTVSQAFVNSVDPDPSYSTFTYNNFFSATLSWKGIQSEQYLQGYKIALFGGYYWNFVSDLLPVSIHSYAVSTFPGDAAYYYVISIADDGSYNNSQPQSQQIFLNVPPMNSPSNFEAMYQTATQSDSLDWKVVTNNQSWYNGYILKRATGSSPSEADFATIAIISDMTSSDYVDTAISLHTAYTYRIYTYAVDPVNSDTSYSANSSTTVNVP